MNKPSDFEIELERMDRDISELKEAALAARVDSQTATKFAYRLYQRAALAGNLSEFETAEAAIERAIRQIGPAPDLYFIKANLDFTFHRLAEVRRDLELGTGLRDSLQGRALQADMDFQEGRYEEAERAYERLIRDSRTWDNLVRLAYLRARMGDVSGAEQLYVEAEDELTAKEMRAYAWVELQRGALDLRHGRYDEAWAHYDRANRAYSGYWLVEEHMAEALGARGNFEEAVALYEKVIARAPRPEFRQALGELYEFMGRPDLAQPCYEKALAAYIESADRGEVHYYHHLSDFYSDVREDGREAVRWAARDVEMRENFSTLAALAWAFYRDRRFTDAMDTINKALSSGVRDAHIFRQAGMIYLSAGEKDEGDRYLRMASEINPHHSGFHVHR
ncbi:MAG TPA: tetratricopeptide repeat protein [Blastocatellia bacterium]|nr:tetratricopeptide repeat protein [Blastocatellia bacterium]